MTKIELKKASDPLSKYAQRARKDPVIVVKKGKPFARSRWFSDSKTRARLIAFFPLSALIIHPCPNAPPSPQVLIDPFSSATTQEG